MFVGFWELGGKSVGIDSEESERVRLRRRVRFTATLNLCWCGFLIGKGRRGSFLK
jgi:hypothetical protein